MNEYFDEIIISRVDDGYIVKWISDNIDVSNTDIFTTWDEVLKFLNYMNIVL